MNLNEFKDRLFDILNETDNFLITDIIVNDKEDSIKVLLPNGVAFRIHCEECKK